MASKRANEESPNPVPQSRPVSEREDKLSPPPTPPVTAPPKPDRIVPHERVVEETPIQAAPGNPLQGYGNGSPDWDLVQIHDLLEHYLLMVKGANRSLPAVGSNAELVKALLGENPDRLAVLPQDSPHLNEEGEIVDRWNRPLFFHFVSRNGVEIRSAGVDGKMWNADDVVSSRGEPHPWLSGGGEHLPVSGISVLN